MPPGGLFLDLELDFGGVLDSDWFGFSCWAFCGSVSFVDVDVDDNFGGVSMFFSSFSSSVGFGVVSFFGMR